MYNYCIPNGQVSVDILEIVPAKRFEVDWRWIFELEKAKATDTNERAMV